MHVDGSDPQVNQQDNTYPLQPLIPSAQSGALECGMAR